MLLALLATIASVAVAQEPVRTPGEAAKQAAEAAAAKDWPLAERAWREAAALATERLRGEPQDFDLAQARDTWEYDAACAAALQGHSDAAFALIAGLLDRGWLDNDDMLATDPDLASLRSHDARFEPMLERDRRLLTLACEGHDEGRILVPAKLTAGSAPSCIVALHGGAGNIEGWAHAWQDVADHLGVVVVLVRGSVVLGKGEFTYDQRRPARDVARIEAWIARAREAVPMMSDSDIFLAGFSQGGGMAWLLGTEGERAWRGIIPIGGYVQVAARPRALREPAHPLAAHAFVGETDEAAIRDVNAQLVAREGLANFRGRLETMPGGHGLPADLPTSIARAMAWCREASASMRR
jgi:predicted esterase